LTGGLANKAKTTTTTPSYNPTLQPLESDLVSQITSQMKDPNAGIEPIRTGLLSDVNSRYAQLPKTVTTQLAQRGYAKSGALGANLEGVDLARMKDLGDVDTQMAQLGLSQQNTAEDLASRFLQGNQTKTTTGSGDVAAGALGAGSQTLTTLLLLNKLMGGGGSGGSGGGGGGDPSIDYGSGAGSW
jgi:hypothetical protein